MLSGDPCSYHVATIALVARGRSENGSKKGSGVSLIDRTTFPFPSSSLFLVLETLFYHQPWLRCISRSRRRRQRMSDPMTVRYCARFSFFCMACIHLGIPFQSCFFHLLSRLSFFAQSPSTVLLRKWLISQRGVASLIKPRPPPPLPPPLVLFFPAPFCFSYSSSSSSSPSLNSSH